MSGEGWFESLPPEAKAEVAQRMSVAGGALPAQAPVTALTDSSFFAVENNALHAKLAAAEARVRELVAALREAIEASANARRCYDLRQRGLVTAHQAEMEMLDALLRIKDKAREALGEAGE